MSTTWPRHLKLHELGRGPIMFQLEPGPEDRAEIARRLGLESLLSLKSEFTATPWFDGVELSGSFRADLVQICGVSLDPFEDSVRGDILVRVVPENSPHAQAPESGDLELDLEAPDAPDILINDAIDVSGYVVEHLALELDPFPRKPGATFEFSEDSGEMSPFAALKALRAPKG